MGVQTLAALIQIASYILLAELARRLMAGTDWRDMGAVAFWALLLFGLAGTLTSGLLLWLHAVDAGLGRDLRLLAKLSRLPLGWFTDSNATAVRQIIDEDAGRLHYRVIRRGNQTFRPFPEREPA